MVGAIAWMDGTVYPNCEKNLDGRTLRERILARLWPQGVMMDVEAATVVVGQMDFRGQAKRICGIYLDPSVEQNPLPGEAQLADGQSVPYPNAPFNLVFAENVVEHLTEAADKVFVEIARVVLIGTLKRSP